MQQLSETLYELGEHLIVCNQMTKPLWRVSSTGCDAVFSNTDKQEALNSMVKYLKSK